MSNKNDNPKDDAPEQSTPDKTESEAVATPKQPTPTKPSDMSEDLIEFITAMDEYKRVNQRPFPSLGEVLEVLKSLGYERPEHAA